MPLVDCALLAVAQELGFFRQHELEVELRKAQSWAQVRDKLMAGEWDAAHSLITMPIQSALENPPGDHPLSYAFTLSRNGNGIIFSNSLWNDGARDPVGLSSWMAQRPGRVLRLGVVFPRGTQEYFLRSWLASGGLTIGEGIALTIIPPQEMVGRLRKGEIDGFCAGEPWSRRASASKLGRLVAESGGILPGLGEKVLAVRTSWHRAHSLAHSRLIRALSQASAWLSDPSNLDAAVEIIASKRYVNTPKSVVEGALRDAAGRASVPGDANGIRFRGGNANAPAPSHAKWYIDQMALWGHSDVTRIKTLDLAPVCLDAFYHSVASALPQSPPARVLTSAAADI
ncbi:MAG: ntrA [Fibrobacteres bacterium]|nr:ntrA [Fibrobacterota bacterium]